MKHVGYYNNSNNKLILLFRTVPNESGSCLVAMTSDLTERLHEDVMSVLESTEGQQAASLADVLYRHRGSNGMPLLEHMHRSGIIKKLPTDKVFLTPAPSVKMSVKELNDIIDGNKSALTEVANTDDEGVVDLSSSNPPVMESSPAPSNQAGLSNEDLAKSLMNQAKMMESEAKSLKEQAYELNPKLKPRTRKRKTTKSEQAS